MLHLSPVCENEGDLFWRPVHRETSDVLTVLACLVVFVFVCLLSSFHLLTMEDKKSKMMTDMLDNIRKRFPDLANVSHFVPIMHFNRTAVLKNIKEFHFSMASPDSGKIARVQLLKRCDDSTREGCQTEDLVASCFRHVLESVEDTMFILFDYNVENYLCNLVNRKDKAKGPTVKGEDRKIEQVKAKDSLQMVEGGSSSTMNFEKKPAGQALQVVSDVTKTNMFPENTAENNKSNSKVESSKDLTEKTFIGVSVKSVSRKKKNKNEASLMSTVPNEQECARNQDQTSQTASTQNPDVRPRASDDEQQDLDLCQCEENPKCKQKKKKKRKEEEDLQTLFQQLEEKAKLTTAKRLFRTVFDFEDDHFRRGQYDILIITRQHGLIVVEAKTMKDRRKDAAAAVAAAAAAAATSASETEAATTLAAETAAETAAEIAADTAAETAAETAADTAAETAAETAAVDLEARFTADFQKTVAKATRQMQQAGLVLRYLVGDLNPQPPITKVLALPYLSRLRLRNLLLDCPELCQALCRCLEVDSIDEALMRCLCEEEASRTEPTDALSSEQNDVTSPGQEPETEDSLLTWWTKFTKGIRYSSDDKEAYERIVSRFCGKYSKVEGQSVADCINLTGILFGRSILRQSQLEILQSDDRFLFIEGPPGSGKTLVLGLKAVEWVRDIGSATGDSTENRNLVIVICGEGVCYGSQVSRLLLQRIKQALGGSCTGSPVSAPEQAPAPLLLKKRQHSSSAATDDVKDEETTPAVKNDQPQHKRKKKQQKTRKNSISKIPKEKKQVLADNVFLETISSDTNVEEFVETVFHKYKAEGQKVLFLLDELQKPVTRENQLNKLTVGVQYLQQIVSEYQHVLSILKEQSESGTSLLEEEEGAGAEEKPVSHEKDILGTMKTKLGYLTKRLQRLRPRPGMPEVMLSKDWENLCKEAFALLEEIRRLQHLVVSHVQRIRLTMKIEKLLEQSDSKMKVSLGEFYHAHNNLNFFVADALLNKLREESSTADTAVWVSTNHSGYVPKDFNRSCLTMCVRCPPTIQEVLLYLKDVVQNHPDFQYADRGRAEDSDFPLPTEGPEVKWIDHSGHLVTYREVNDCVHCGHALADFLLNDLGIGSSNNQEDGGLRPEDVLISGSPVHQPDCSFLKTLQERGIDTEFEKQEMTSPPPYAGKVLIMALLLPNVWTPSEEQTWLQYWIASDAGTGNTCGVWLPGACPNLSSFMLAGRERRDREKTEGGWEGRGD